ncbi:uncharacterized protein N7443_001776 [Penicillium atrosanguineum]|uniref:uncharacterized protein n=1 Tax=Penicillium atrosanguineum TaxID=1132637 RepID=UPI0023A71F9A|nr:uncharacterized protein N7443_001776 [Penicillium atrosanguineum]KAJ5117870.1 hypothetical protein N7526_010893 [Penicillium atrosanguineum]KAJ5309315.1 hypothetical protein N7443_001776 [Penicillium atrosanguineum]
MKVPRRSSGAAAAQTVVGQQFLSWLFEGALSHCAPVPSEKGASASRYNSKHEKDVAPTLSYSSTSGETDDVEYTRPSRTGLSWEKQKLAWSEVTKRFVRKFTRTKGSLQVV